MERTGLEIWQWKYGMASSIFAGKYQNDVLGHTVSLSHTVGYMVHTSG